MLQPGYGHRVPDARDLALNLSFVLHERADSRAVQRAVRASQSHARMRHRFRPELGIPATVNGERPTGVTRWLTATIGLPHLLADALNTSPDSLMLVDADTTEFQPCQFFRAPAQLSLPDASASRVAVAALILRPDRRSSHLVTIGAYAWPLDRDRVMREVERLIQAHTGQWMPSHTLWTAPAESLLGDEVY